MTIPLWIYAVVAGIFFSAFMTIKTSRAEKKIDEEFIEQEGQVYIQRMEKEREMRAKS
ncbi:MULTISPECIES: sporulation YhaL family protein [Bacillaceae]|uniref:SigE-dependent sporulation protein n=1 Tax=Pseudobacillus wudalianchiensis TaxID=1743143 RepID=A0A1B9AUN3_9BACI|nr:MULTISPECIES: sporulation YhaL family protein [Bacillus]KMY53167.1 SigE-dependent sporulation protein [Bacillus sp. FJAT-27231]OCA87408.1 SigE-dependent sporulation protein [Bacillus wudalianchiensis]